MLLLVLGLSVRDGDPYAGLRHERLRRVRLEQRDDLLLVRDRLQVVLLRTQDGRGVDEVEVEALKKQHYQHTPFSVCV